MSVACVDTSVLVAIAFDEPAGAGMANRLEAFSHLLASNLLEAEMRAAFAREGADFSEHLLASLQWVFPDRSLTPEITAVLTAGHLRGADLWHVASALYVKQGAGDMWFVTLDERQRSVAAALGFRV